MTNNFPSKKRVLVCPLDWGLGHASRMIPVIKRLLEHKNDVIIAADKLPLNLLKEEFPFLEFIRLSSYNIRYSQGKSQVFSILFQVPKLLREIIREHKKVREIIRYKNIDFVISDNRFGCWTKKTKSVYVTHQLMVKMPKGLKVLEYPGFLIHRWFINKYDECWIPDFEGENNLSGDLSHRFKLSQNTSFIGPLSRFEGFVADLDKEKHVVVSILSGPEPQRTIFEENISDQLKGKDFSVLIVRGRPGDNEKDSLDNISFVNHLSTNELGNAIANADLVICRSGYSSIMDLVALNKKAILIPTPGQTEQEYLAEHLKNNGLFEMIKQSELESLKPLINSVITRSEATK